jgi:uncharacterized protein (TIGR02452 family)
MDLKQIAQDTILILEQGHYQSPGGHMIDLAADLHDCADHTRYYEPEILAGIRDNVLSQPAQYYEMVFEVRNETTLQGSARLAANHANSKIGVLNFASAKNPGGGFLNGARAQEESLARSSGLYINLLRGRGFYPYHRVNRSLFYSDRMIYSPHCPVFRTDDGTLLEQPYFVDFITSPAPNAGVLRQRNEPDLDMKLETVLRERASKFLALALYNGCDILVLGAWGCGVFRNDPCQVARIFGELLGPNRPYWQRFRRVVFSVWDTSRSKGTYQPFFKMFAF